MKKILILGAGTAGTMMANHLIKKINKKEWEITIIDKNEKHYYQPGFLFIPFDIYSEKDVVKPKLNFLPKGIEYIQTSIELIDPKAKRVVLANSITINYDILIIATGCNIAPDETEGLSDGWRKEIFDFYTFEGSVALRNKLRTWKGGKLVVHITEMPIKCPVAPLEFAFLADWFFKEKKNIRNNVELTYVTPLSGAFTKPKISAVLSQLFIKKNIEIVPNFTVSRVDAAKRKLVSVDEREVDYDLLVTIPTIMGDALIERSGLGDELNFIPTNKHSLQSTAHEDIFVIGDASNLPTSKAGSVAHFEAEILTENIISFINKKSLAAHFDGHSNCYIESGFNKALLIDFNYDVEPVEGTFPIPGIGPFSLLKETKINHLGKMAFRHLYWHVLLKGISIPTVPAHMKTSGKKLS